MTLSLVIQGLVEIVVSLITGLFIFFCSFKFYNLTTKNIDELAELKNKNTAVGLLVASFILGIMLQVQTAITPAFDILTVLINAQKISFTFIILGVVRLILVYLIAAVIAFVVLWLSIRFFMILTTKIDELDEIKNNNTGVSIMIGTLILSVTIVIRDPLSEILRGIVPFSLADPIINLSVFLPGLIKFGIALIAVIFIFFFGFKTFSLLTKKIDEINELKANNIAVAILISSFILAMVLLINSSVNPANKVLSDYFEKGSGIMPLIFALLRILGFFILSAIFAFVMIWMAMKAFMILTVSINEMEEIKNKNIAVALIISILVISTALLLAHGLTQLLEGLVRQPRLDAGLQNLPKK